MNSILSEGRTCGSGDNFVEDRTQYYGEVVDMEDSLEGMLSLRYTIYLIQIHY